MSPFELAGLLGCFALAACGNSGSPNAGSGGDVTGGSTLGGVGHSLGGSGTGATSMNGGSAGTSAGTQGTAASGGTSGNAAAGNAGAGKGGTGNVSMGTPGVWENVTPAGDLYFRLAGAHVHVPPLRDRMDDLPLLVEHFLARADPPRTLRDVAPPVWEMFRTHRWPGNVREPRNAVERLLVTPERPI